MGLLEAGIIVVIVEKNLWVALHMLAVTNVTFHGGSAIEPLSTNILKEWRPREYVNEVICSQCRWKEARENYEKARLPFEKISELHGQT